MAGERREWRSEAAMPSFQSPEERERRVATSAATVSGSEVEARSGGAGAAAARDEKHDGGEGGRRQLQPTGGM